MDLAHAAGIAQGKLSAIETDSPRGGVAAPTLARLAVALGVTSDWLLGLSEAGGPGGPENPSGPALGAS